MTNGSADPGQTVTWSEFGHVGGRRFTGVVIARHGITITVQCSDGRLRQALVAELEV